MYTLVLSIILPLVVTNLTETVYSLLVINSGATLVNFMYLQFITIVLIY